MYLKDLFIGIIIIFMQKELTDQGTNIYELLSESFQGIKRLFVLAYAIAANAASNEAGIKDNGNRSLKKPLMFICRQKIKFILQVFLEILQRYCKPGYTNPK